ncbi:MAG: hypothetical protein ABGY10_13675, partial [bacterium]
DEGTTLCQIAVGSRVTFETYGGRILTMGDLPRRNSTSIKPATLSRFRQRYTVFRSTLTPNLHRGENLMVFSRDTRAAFSSSIHTSKSRLDPPVVEHRNC